MLISILQIAYASYLDLKQEYATTKDLTILLLLSLISITIIFNQTTFLLISITSLIFYLLKIYKKGDLYFFIILAATWPLSFLNFLISFTLSCTLVFLHNRKKNIERTYFIPYFLVVSFLIFLIEVLK
jgi:hypothetical protein